jgi:MGT family glycosyltransferase
MATAFFFNQSSTGHVNPTLGLVAELVRRGETIVYYAHEAERARIQATGAHFRAFEDSVPAPRIEGNAHLALFKLQEALALLPRLLEIVRRERPDYLLFDAMCPLGWLIARIEQLPSISSSSTLAFTPAVLRALLEPEQLEHLLSGEGSDYVRGYEDLAAHLQSEYNVDMPDWLRSLNLFGDMTLLYTSTAMHPAAETLDASFRLIGPCLRPADPAPDFPYAALERENLVYISLGTVFNDNLRFYRDCIAAFAGSPYHVILSIGERVELDALGEVPENIVVFRSVPQLDVLQRARLFVSHGGANSVHEALYYGVPLVLVPQMFEQEMNARQVVVNGAGIRLDRTTVTPDRLRQAVDSMMLQPAFRQNAERVGATLRAAGGAARAADEILAWLNCNVESTIS